MNNDIYVKEHDCLDFDAELIKESDNTTYTLPTGAKLWFCFKKHKDDEELLRIEQTETHFHKNSMDYPVGKYLAEIGIVFSNGSTTTVEQFNLWIEDRRRDED